MPLLVSKRQLAAITAVLEQQENQLLLNYAKKRFPTIVVAGSEECSTEWIQSVRKRARSFGIEQGKNLAIFIDLMIMYGHGFEETDWAGGTLRSKTFSESQKINVLKQKLKDQGIFI